MRPRILLKGTKPVIPEVRNDLSPAPRRVQPKKVDDFMDKVFDVKNLKGEVIFRGTPRQWQKWASAREVQARLAVGLPAVPVTRAGASRR